MRAPVLATGRAFSSQRARAVSEKRKAARARARIHQNQRAHSVRIQNSDHACMNSEFCMHARAGWPPRYRRFCAVSFFLEFFSTCSTRVHVFPNYECHGEVPGHQIPVTFLVCAEACRNRSKLIRAKSTPGLKANSQ